jgi:hypothetical protein
MADVTNLKNVIDAYGIGVRAGVLTPCLQDENAFRKMLGLADAPKEVVDSWSAQGGTRAPITLQRVKDIEEAIPEQTPEPETTEPEEDDNGQTA